MQQKIIVVGAGIFGVTAALELKSRGHDVSIFDPGPIPHPEASSTDITKMIRMDYGTDTLYYNMMEQAFEGWRAWNAEWGEDLFHEDGFLLMRKDPFAPGIYEQDCFDELTKRGHNPTRVNSEKLAADHPMWNAEVYADGYRNDVAGWAQSGRVVEKLSERMREVGISIHEGAAMQSLLQSDGTVTGIVTADGIEHTADVVIVAAGAWTPVLLPELEDVMWPTGHPVIHFDPPNPDDFRPPTFRPWSADISRTGWYGFPLHPTGVVKIANHGDGIPVDPPGEKVVPQEWIDRALAFVKETFPALADAPIMKTRLCMYCDTWDGDLWVDHDPNRPGLVVASGGSGHGFKFAPVLGGLIADVVEKRPNPFAERFAWRERGELRRESARFDSTRELKTE
ncbi:MAG: FAD-dependent oxidoreductase [Chloroflexota bacterium]